MNTRYFTVAGSNRRYDRNWMLAVLLISLMLSLLQVSSVNNLLASIQGSMHSSETDIQFVLSGYALAVGITLVPTGRLGDIFGRPGMWVTGLTIFTLASLGCGLADNALHLNLLRVLQGIGAGFYSPQVTGLIQQYFQGKARARAFGYMGLVVAVSVALGPLISGTLVQIFGSQTGWRYSFFINVPFGVVGIIAATQFLPFANAHKGADAQDHVESDASRSTSSGSDSLGSEVRETSSPTAPRRSQLDLDPLGMVLLVAAVLCIMLPFMLHTITWRFALLPCAVVLLVTWVWWEKHYARLGNLPMVDMSMFRLRSFTYCTAIGGLQFLGSSTIFVVLALFIQQGLHGTALDIGLIGLPYAVLSGTAAMWSGKHSIEYGKQIQVLGLSLILTSVVMTGFISWGLADRGWSHWWLILGLLPLGLGAGSMGAANQTTAMMDVPAANGGTAGGLQQTTQRIATAIGNALITGVLYSTYRGGTTSADWYLGLAAGLAVIAVCITCALVLAIVFEHRSRKYASVSV